MIINFVSSIAQSLKRKKIVWNLLPLPPTDKILKEEATLSVERARKPAAA
jgi:hypothetical protein